MPGIGRISVVHGDALLAVEGKGTSTGVYFLFISISLGAAGVLLEVGGGWESIKEEEGLVR